MKKFSKLLASILFLMVGFFWLYLILVVTILMIPESLWDKALSIIDLILALSIAFPVICVWLFISAYTWVRIFSNFFDKEIFINQINRLGGPEVVRNYLLKKLL